MSWDDVKIGVIILIQLVIRGLPLTAICKEGGREVTPVLNLRRSKHDVYTISILFLSVL